MRYLIRFWEVNPNIYTIHIFTDYMQKVTTTISFCGCHTFSYIFIVHPFYGKRPDTFMKFSQQVHRRRKVDARREKERKKAKNMVLMVKLHILPRIWQYIFISDDSSTGISLVPFSFCSNPRNHINNSETSLT